MASSFPTFNPPKRMGRILNPIAWAVGYRDTRGLHVRRVVWGRLLAREERREGESIFKVRIVSALESDKERWMADR